MPLKEPTPKKDRLTLSQLAGYDDILTDALVDHVYFWTTIRKNRSKYNSARGISEDDVTEILLRDVVVAKDPQEAEASLLKLPGLRKFNDNLKSEREREDFRRHMRKYINIWLPDCPFEVSTTNRYTIVTHEAAATARRFIKKGDTVKYLCGNLVAMTPEEEKDLDLTRRDFSIVMSSRKKTPSLFLGPARFANHDCDANAKLVTRGSEGMQVVAVRDIERGKEITVTYGDNYFGEENCECLCQTCENEGRNGWPALEKSRFSSGTTTPLIEAGIDAVEPYSFRRTRRHGQCAALSSVSITPEIDEGRARKRRKIGALGARSSLGMKSADSQSPGSVTKVETSGSALRHEILDVHNDTQSSPVTSAQDRARQDEDELLAGVRAAFTSAKGLITQIRQARDFDRPPRVITTGASPPFSSDSPGNRGDSSLITGHSSQCTELAIPNSLIAPSTGWPSVPNVSLQALPTPNPSSDGGSIFSDAAKRSSSPATTPSASLDGKDAPKPYPLPSILDDSDLSDLPDSEFLDDIHLTIIHQPFKKRKRAPRNSKKIVPTVELGDDIPIVRYLGDYIRTPLLLGESYSRWVDCGTCSTCWVQQNGYLTRKECPRCERHSKLYGYQWPKTDKQGKGDEEERVMDHRTVHRFLKREEEVRVKKRGRGLERGGSMVSSERTQSLADERGSERAVSTVRRRGRPRKGERLAV